MQFNEPMEDVGMNNLNPSRNDDPSRPPEESHDLRHDFDNGANALWSLYEKEVESVDKVRIQALKDDMDGVLIFVCMFPSVIGRVDFILDTGWFILRCHHCVRRPQDSGFESRPCGPISLLPATIRSDSCSNISANRVDGPSDPNQSHSPIALPYLPFVGPRSSRGCLLAYEPRIQSVGRTCCDSRPAMGSGIFAPLPAA